MKKILPLCAAILLTTCLVSAKADAQSSKAVDYRTEGYKLQRSGDLKGAIVKYKKAIKADNSYATPHNDLGVVYEMQGRMSAAENEYLQALKVDPKYIGVYSNLALLYEKKGDIKRAIIYWKKRAELGNPQDKWTKKAQENVDRLSKRVISDSETIPSSASTDDKRKAINNMVKNVKLQKKRNKGFAPRGSRGSMKAMMKQAKIAIKQDRFQDAIKRLEDAKQVPGADTLKIDEMIKDARSKEIDMELAKAAMTADVYKKNQLVAVENAWLPPTPEIVESAATQDYATPTKSKARVALEEKAKQIIPSIDFNDAQLKEVVEFLAVSNDINIVIDETVVPRNETVTIHLKNIPLEEALDIILRTKGLKYRFEENIIWITTEEKLLEEDLEVRVYDVQDLVGKLFDFPSVPFDFKANLEVGTEEE